MEALFTSTLTVALAEIGDKTQLLALLLATRFSNKYALISGILVATLINHGLSAVLGVYFSQFVPANLMTWVIGVSFIAVGLWLLIPDKNDETSHAYDKYGAFVATLILFFLAELGDKTQFATILLAADYNAVMAVTVGTTLGMLLANVPVVYLGHELIKRIPVKMINIVAAILFIGLGVSAIVF
tara:strand:- start:9 stop:563 length:555 start_codon:yes stop_codon:yes gene_type:complete